MVDNMAKTENLEHNNSINLANMLTVKEYAQAAGVTVQAVYKRMNAPKSELQSYIVEIGGKRYIKPEALDIIKPKVTVETNELENLRETVEFMKAQIEEKDNQIKEKDVQISNLQQQAEQLIKQNSQLTSALESTTESLKAAQALHAGTIQQQLESESMAKSPEAPVEDQSVTTSTRDNKEDEPRRGLGGIISRLFRR